MNIILPVKEAFGREGGLHIGALLQNDHIRRKHFMHNIVEFITYIRPYISKHMSKPVQWIL